MLDPAGKPVANAIVEVHRDHPATADSGRRPRFVAGTASSGPDGRFELTDLGPGPATLHLSATDHPGALPARIEVIEVDVRGEIGADSGADLGDLHLTPGHRIAGRVEDEDGNPVEGARVEISGFGDRRPGGGFQDARATSDADGAFAFEDRAAGEHELIVSRNKPPSTASAKLSTPDDGGPVLLVLRTGLSLAGRVVDADGAPIAGAEVESRLRRSLTGPASATTDGAGNFLLIGLRAGEHRLTAGAEGYLEERRLILFAEGVDPDPVVLELIGGIAVTGAVRWPDGRPVAGVRVYGQGVDGADWATPSQTTGAAGSFSIAPLPPGPANVIAVMDSLRVERRIEVGSASAPGADPVTLTLPAGVRISGRVLDEAGEPVAAAQVWLGSREVGGSWTDTDGRFVLADVPPGPHTLSVDHPDYAEHEAADRLEVEGEPIDDLRIELVRGSVITGRVEGVAAAAGGRARISLDRRDGPEDFSVDLDSEGRFRVERVPPGEYEIEARATVVVATGSFTLPPGTETLEVELTPVAGADLRGRVIQRGRGVANVRVAVRAPVQSGGRSADGYTSADGRFVLRLAPPGARGLEVDDPGGHVHWLALDEIEVTDDGELRVELPAGDIAGRVTDPSGQPIARAAVFLEDLGEHAETTHPGGWRSRTLRRVRADSQGVFVLYAVAPGRYRVRSEHALPGVGDGLALREVEVASEPIRGVDLSVSPPHRLTLRVTPAPDPASGMGLSYVLYDPEGRLELTSAAGAGDDSGRVVLENVPEGEWTLWIGTFDTVLQGIDVSAPSDAEIPVELVQGGSVGFDLPQELFDAKPYDLDVVLRDGQGRERPGPPGQPIRLLVMYDGSSDEPARAYVGHLPPGKWTIELRYLKGRRWRGEFRVFAGQEAEVRLTRVPPETDSD